jgi:hypothetical protein
VQPLIAGPDSVTGASVANPKATKKGRIVDVDLNLRQRARYFIARCRDWLGAWRSSNAAPTMEGARFRIRSRNKQKIAVLMD